MVDILGPNLKCITRRLVVLMQLLTFGYASLWQLKGKASLVANERRVVTKVNPHSQRSCYGHLGESNGQTSLGKIMARADQSPSYSRANRLHSIVGVTKVNLRYSGIRKKLLKQVAAYHFRVVRACHFLACCADQVEQVTRCFERHING